MRQFAALADPLRREVVELLAAGPIPAGEIAARFPVTRPAASRHLRLLRATGLVRSEIRWQSRVYVLERAALAEPDRWLDRFGPLVGAQPDGPLPAAEPERPLPGPAGRLDALDTELRRGHRARRAAPTTGDDRAIG